MNQTESRKHEHISISLEKDVKSHYNFWDEIKLKVANLIEGLMDKYD